MRALIAGYVLTLLSVAPVIAEQNVTKPYVVLSGAHSHITNAAYHRVTSRQDWTELWLEHVGDRPSPQYSQYYNRAGVPDVDFSTCMVIAVFMGSGWNNAGLTVLSTRKRNGEMVIGFDTKHYQSRETGDEVTPYGFFIIPLTEQAVQLQINKQSYRSRIEKGAPVWEDSHRFEALSVEE